MPTICLHRVNKTYQQKVVLKDISLNIRQGECVVLTGHNGSGKSTLLKILAALLFPSSGKITAWSATGDIADVRAGYAIDRLPPLPFTAEEYLLSMGGIQRLDRREAQSQMMTLMDALHLKQNTKQQIASFSKGMRQKVNLIQALMGKPDLLLLDEPLSGLDYDSQLHFSEILYDLKRAGTTIICASHESMLIHKIADSVVELENGRVYRVIQQEELTFTDVVVIKAGNLTDDQIALLGAFEGIIEICKETAKHEMFCMIKVTAASSDKLILNIIRQGGTIKSVTHDEYHFYTIGRD
ncbi:ATP-binding cassette domain-containing protein [Paenibacillus sp. PDC88]|uniref:ATP-binding cassette domain-containing protein n=1 Tax=Paenibacillus sp. PDC88 TaxID=1884375 RepID=UPI00089C27F9|nr:ABC transporter ATP-binding protein [Paenibacillus sp. PDC88]SDW13829.1 ABC-type multidrug transport system, ATPase component [Paenibacillus sp. PDC88]